MGAFFFILFALATLLYLLCRAVLSIISRAIQRCGDELLLKAQNIGKAVLILLLLLNFLVNILGKTYYYSTPIKTLLLIIFSSFFVSFVNTVYSSIRFYGVQTANTNIAKHALLHLEYTVISLGMLVWNCVIIYELVLGLLSV